MISTKDVFREGVFVFDRVQVDYEGCTFAGPGVGRWVPNTGLALDGVMRIVRGKSPHKVTFGLPRFEDGSGLATVRLRTATRTRAVVFLDGRLTDQLQLIATGHFTIRSAQLTAWYRDDFPVSRPGGHLILEGKVGARLPDRVVTQVHVGGRKLHESQELGLDFSEDDFQLVIRPNSDVSYTLWWSLPNGEGGLEGRVADWPLALARAWQFMCGRSVWPIASELRDGRRRIVIIRRRLTPVSLRSFCLVDKDEVIGGKRFLAIARLFASRSKESVVADHLLTQCFDATAGKTGQIVMLMLGTALEAVLRTLYGHPFKDRKKDDHFNRVTCIDRLWSDYFDSEWEPIKARVKAVFNRVRHRAAHPDWLESFGGKPSSKRQQETFDDLIFISRFYGYLVLAMARIPNLRPSFPAPSSQWKPALTYTNGKQEGESLQ